MSALSLTSANFQRLLQKLMPRGAVWSRDTDAIQTQMLGALAPTYERSTYSANSLLVDSFPATAYNLLPEWEEALGLPDPCAGESPLLSDRQAQVVSRLTARGGNMSVPYYIGFAANLGYQVQIETYAPFRAGRNSAGDCCNDAKWSSVWKVKAPQFSINFFEVGDRAGDPLAWWGSTALQCELLRVSPAHTTLIFDYT